MEFTENNYPKMVELFNYFGKDKSLYDAFYAADYPVPYKTLTLFPFQVDLYIFFHKLVPCLLLPHKTSGDIKAISMCYLDYLVYLAYEKRLDYLSSLTQLLLITLKLPNTYLVKGVEHTSIEFVEVDEKWKISIQGVLFDGKDFDEIREIICCQNAIELPDETTHPDVLKAYKDMEEYRSRQAKIKLCSFEDQMNVIVAKSPYKREDCVKMTIRSFTRLLERVDKIMHYEIYTLLSPNLKPESQKSIESYLSASKTQKDKYNEAFVDINKVEQKMK